MITQAAVHSACSMKYVHTYYSVQALKQSHRLYTIAYGTAMGTSYFVYAFLTVLSVWLQDAS